jgi:hypothetical protein
MYVLNSFLIFKCIVVKYVPANASNGYLLILPENLIYLVITNLSDFV